MRLNASVASNPSNTTAEVPSAKSDTPAKRQVKLDLPWNDIQKWALEDNLGKYTVQVPDPTDGVTIYTLWRTLSNDVPELSGYPLPFLVDRAKESKKLRVSSTILPYLDDFSFEPNGGMKGRVSGVPGVADGTIVQTTPVGDVAATVPKGFVQTFDGTIVYELGRPSEVTEASSGDSRLRRSTSMVKESLTAAGSEIEAVASDGDLLRLAGLTSMVVGGAWAFESLSHHLTVNVFWV